MTTSPTHYPTLGIAVRSRLWTHQRFDPLQIILALPTSIAITLLVMATGFYTHGMNASQHLALLNRIGAEVNDFDARRVLTLPIATFVQSSPGVRWHMVLLVLIPLVLLECVTGSGRAAAIWLLSDWISAPITLLAIWSFAELGSHAANRLLSVPDAGSSAAAHGTIAAVCLTLPGRWRWAGIAMLFTIDFTTYAFLEIDVATAHTVASAVGLGLGLLIIGRSRGADEGAGISTIARRG